QPVHHHGRAADEEGIEKRVLNEPRDTCQSFPETEDGDHDRYLPSEDDEAVPTGGACLVLTKGLHVVDRTLVFDSQLSVPLGELHVKLHGQAPPCLPTG